MTDLGNSVFVPKGYFTKTLICPVRREISHCLVEETVLTHYVTRGQGGNDGSPL